MFGIFKKRIQLEPLDFVIDLEIDRPPAEIFAMIEWANPANRQAALGHRVVANGEDRFDLFMKSAPETAFHIRVLESHQDELYRFITEIPAEFGRLNFAEETYTFGSDGAGGTRLNLVTRATFETAMTEKEARHEIGLVAIATQNALTKLRMHAEHGLQAALKVEDAILV